MRSSKRGCTDLEHAFSKTGKKGMEEEQARFMASQAGEEM